MPATVRPRYMHYAYATYNNTQIQNRVHYYVQVIIIIYIYIIKYIFICATVVYSGTRNVISVNNDCGKKIQGVVRARD